MLKHQLSPIHIRPFGGSILAALLLGLRLASAVDIRWSVSSNRIYVDGPGSATLSDIALAVPNAPLTLLDATNRVWYLGANLIVESNAQLQLHGPAMGGDVSELRLKSDNNNSANAIVEVSADWGWLDIRNTRITSWDDAINGPDTETDTHGRSFIHVRSTLDPDGVTAHESRMDVIDSDIGYLGYNDSEAYGLTWKVVGVYAGPTNSIFDAVNVYGDILNSHLHHNYFGMYSFGHYGGHWATNELDHNVGYGMDPHDDSDYELIENNNVHDNGWDGIIASKRCDHLILRNNFSHGNGQNGIILHRSSNDSLVEHNQCVSNGTTGIVLTGDWRCLVRSNLVMQNAEAGIRLDLGSADNVIEGNESASNVWYGLYLYKGSDTPEPGDDGRPKRNWFAHNLVHHNAKDGVNLADSDDNTYATNQFYANNSLFTFNRGFQNALDGNDIAGTVIVKTTGNSTAASSTYVSHQPSLRIQVDVYSSVIFEDPAGQVFDPEENALATHVTASGSTLALTAAEIGTTSTVVTRNLWVNAATGIALVNPTSWTNAADSNKQWTTQTASPGQSFSYTAGDLRTNRVYQVLKGGLFVTAATSDPVGKIRFSDPAGSTNEVVYSIEPGPPLRISNVTATAGSFCFSWASLPGAEYHVEGVPGLNNTNWYTLSPTLTAAGYSTTFCLPLPSPFHFFRLGEGSALVSALPLAPVIAAKFQTNGFLLGWLGSVTSRYQVQWTPTLSQPWNVFTNILVSSTGAFSFLDDGSQVGGLGSRRFYRLIQVP